MENASQALIIAGAILLAILIIGIGMFIFNSAKSQIDDATAQLDQNTVKTTNSKFENYDGVITGTQAKALIRAAGQHAAEIKKQTGDNLVSPNVNLELSKTTGAGTGTGTATPTGEKEDAPGIYSLTQSIRDLNKYRVTFEYNDTSGVITKINIVEDK